jgi:hypothetical protein
LLLLQLLRDFDSFGRFLAFSQSRKEHAVGIVIGEQIIVHSQHLLKLSVPTVRAKNFSVVPGRSWGWIEKISFQDAAGSPISH